MGPEGIHVLWTQFLFCFKFYKDKKKSSNIFLIKFTNCSNNSHSFLVPGIFRSQSSPCSRTYNPAVDRKHPSQRAVAAERTRKCHHLPVQPAKRLNVKTRCACAEFENICKHRSERSVQFYENLYMSDVRVLNRA